MVLEVQKQEQPEQRCLNFQPSAIAATLTSVMLPLFREWFVEFWEAFTASSTGDAALHENVRCNCPEVVKLLNLLEGRLGRATTAAVTATSVSTASFIYYRFWSKYSHISDANKTRNSGEIFMGWSKRWIQTIHEWERGYWTAFALKSHPVALFTMDMVSIVPIGTFLRMFCTFAFLFWCVWVVSIDFNHFTIPMAAYCCLTPH